MKGGMIFASFEILMEKLDYLNGTQDTRLGLAGYTFG